MLDYNISKGDCLQLLKSLPDKYVDLILTDPPYNISKDNNFTTIARNRLEETRLKEGQ